MSDWSSGLLTADNGMCLAVLSKCHPADDLPVINLQGPGTTGGLAHVTATWHDSGRAYGIGMSFSMFPCMMQLKEQRRLVKLI